MWGIMRGHSQRQLCGRKTFFSSTFEDLKFSGLLLGTRSFCSYVSFVLTEKGENISKKNSLISSLHYWD